MSQIQLMATLHLLPAAAGGRQTAIKKDVYRPQFHLGSSSASCRVDDIDKEMLSPGEESEVQITLAHPERFERDLQPGRKFDIKEGWRVVGWGIIKEVKGQ